MTQTDDFYRGLLDNMFDGVYFVDPERRITFWNKGAERITGYGGPDMTGLPCQNSRLVHVDKDGNPLCENGCPVAATLRDGQVRAADVALRHRDGFRLPVRIRVAPIVDDAGRITGAVETFTDDSRTASLEERLRALEAESRLDVLTRVGNRRYGEEKIRDALSELRNGGRAFGLMFLDLDRFKSINDGHGHEVGDRVLRMVAATLQRVVRVDDVLARWGGEEFVGVLRQTDPDRIGRVAERCRVMVAASSVETEAGRLHVTVSCGVTMARPDDSVATLIERADRLMYVSKSAGRNRVTLDAA